jgi:hypothetical protein
VTTVEATTTGDHGVDVDRAGTREGLLARFRRRLGGRYPIDPFGADPMVMDLLGPAVRAVVRVRVLHGDRLPRTGGALLVANRGLGLLEPAALAVAVSQVSGRRLRVVGAPGLAVLGPMARKLGAVPDRPGDVAALLRAGRLAAVPLAPTWLRPGAGEPPRPLLMAILGFPVIPVAVLPGGPLGLPARPWQVVVGTSIEMDIPARPGDALAAAELAERVRDAVGELIAGVST